MSAGNSDSLDRQALIDIQMVISANTQVMERVERLLAMAHVGAARSSRISNLMTPGENISTNSLAELAKKTPQAIKRDVKAGLLTPQKQRGPCGTYMFSWEEAERYLGYCRSADTSSCS